MFGDVHLGGSGVGGSDRSTGVCGGSEVRRASIGGHQSVSGDPSIDEVGGGRKRDPCCIDVDTSDDDLGSTEI